MSGRAIGIFGGTFDPIHYGHLRTALEVCEALSLQRVHFIPSATPPHRQRPQVGAAQRAEMVKRAIADEPRFLFDDRELRRTGPSWMTDTLRSLRREVGEQQPLCLILGSDAFKGLHTWHEWQQLPELAHIVVMHRPGWSLGQDTAPEISQLMQERAGELHDMESRSAGRVITVAVSQLAISATDIRYQVGEGKSPRYLLPEGVWQFIQSNQLYQHS